jgi:hypothetical protein
MNSTYHLAHILTQNLGMRRVSAKLVPRLLTQDQTERRAAASRDLLQRAEAL